MPSDLPRYTLRIPQEYLDKIRYIAEENGRSANREIELMIKSRIQEYEQQHGQIRIDSDSAGIRSVRRIVVCSRFMHPPFCRQRLSVLWRRVD